MSASGASGTRVAPTGSPSATALARWAPLVLGLAACIGVAAVARLVGSTLGIGLDTSVALVLGLAVGASAEIRTRLLPGAALAARVALRTGIALLGARLTVGQVLETGAASALGIVVLVSAALAGGTLIARRLGVHPPLSALITAGMAICGNSAILALSPIIRAPHRATAYAVSTITIFGLVGVLVVPLLAAALGLSDAVAGTWAGLAVNDTAQVVATGYAISPAAGDTATVVKLTRNLAILPVLLGATSWIAREEARAAGGATAGVGPTARVGLRSALTRAVPWFVLAFLLVAALRSAGVLDVAVPSGGTLADLASTLATLLILVALAGVGISTDVRTLIGVGARPFLLGAAMWVVFGAVALGIAMVVAGGVG